ncbi:hypothetical protein F4780DRAFT_784397 [Xylariomycetidae sp. FL0641]|nr:hypothetical protein F4780DRAFT_784397 [Xylariomycetidae sp. FL0641]
MDKAKASLKNFMSQSGAKDTTVHKTEAAPVQHETVKPTQHEDVNTAVDKEIHQDHYHQTVQPIADREVLPEQHHHKLGEVQHREFDHRDNEATRAKLAAESQKFKDERVVEDTTHTQSHAPIQEGQHVHHHVHETIQPMIHKETVQPHVVHSTVPIHETHHETAQHHGTSSLPPMNLADYQRAGGVLGGEREKFERFDGHASDRGGLMSALHGGKKKSAATHGDFDPLDEGKAGRHVDPAVAGTGTTTKRTSSGVIGGKGAVGPKAAATDSATGAPLASSGSSDAGRDDATTAAQAAIKNPGLLDRLNPIGAQELAGRVGNVLYP